MTLDLPLIKQIIKDNPNAQTIEAKRALSKVLRANVTGEGADELIEQIKGFERPELQASRKKMMMSNRDIVYRTLKPRERIYTAKGGIESYNFTNLNDIEEFKEYLSNITGQMSLKEYIEQVIQPKFDYDPNGLKWVDINSQGVPYPCFKSINCIFEIELNGRRPEYVFFKCTQKEIAAYVRNGIIDKALVARTTDAVYRVVCDSYDRIVIVGGGGADNAFIASEAPNYFGYVPGEIVSDIVGSVDEYYDSCLNNVIELLAHFMFGRSLFNIALARAAYPKEWMHRFPCPTCKGEQTINAEPCPECHGTGALPAQQNSDVLIVDYGNDVNKSIPTPPMGTVDPAVEALQFMKDNNYSIEEMVERTLWGVVTVTNSSGKSTGGKGSSGDVQKTAYEISVNDEPKMNTLRRFSKWYASTYKWFADTCAGFIYKKRFISSAILGGDRYMTESADAILDRMVAARTANAAQSTLDSLMQEYLENKYQNNPLQYRKYYLLYIAEPFYWNTVADVLSWVNIPEIQKLEKQYFPEWAATLTDVYFASMPDQGAEPKLKADLTAYVMGKYAQGVQYDNLLFAQSGQLLEVGSNVQVREDKLEDPQHLGKTFTVSLIKGRDVTLQDTEDNYITGYTIDSFIKN